MQNSLRSDSCIFAPDADSCELRVSRHPANAIRGTLFPELTPTEIEKPTSETMSVHLGKGYSALEQGESRSGNRPADVDFAEI